MKVKKITVKNLKSVSDMTADFNGCTAIITGGNNKGKSTFLKTFVDRIQGNKPNKIIKKGEKEGSCEYELTDGSKFVRELKGEKEKLSYITSDGVEIKTGVIKNFSKRFFGEGFDIDEFLQSQPKKQKEQLQKILGIDLSELEAEYKRCYDNRTEKNSILKNEKSRCEGLVLQKVGEKKDLSELQNKIVDTEKTNQNIEYVKKRLDEKKESKEDIKEQIRKLQEKQKSILGEIKKGEDYLENNKIIEIGNLKKEYEKQKEENDKIEQNEIVKKQLENLKTVEEEYEEANLKVKAVEDKKLEVLKSANIPKGFEFTDDGLLYNGYELDKKQLSSSSIYIASLKLASMGIGEIRTLCFDASYLDKNSLQEIESRAIKNDLQLLIERPDYDGGELKYEIISCVI